MKMCECLPRGCVASDGGKKLGRMSVISDIGCKACVPALRAPTSTIDAPALLDAAAKHMRDRAATYDQPEGERSMETTVKTFNTLTGLALTESQGWTFMLLLKLVRDQQRKDPHQDSIEDSVAYAALRGEARAAGR